MKGIKIEKRSEKKKTEAFNLHVYSNQNTLEGPGRSKSTLYDYKSRQSAPSYSPAYKSVCNPYKNLFSSFSFFLSFSYKW